MKSGTSDGIWNNLYIVLHELSHTLFRFPDMEHGMGDDRWYATGSFDAMFRGVPSLYNPLFRIENGWVVPTRITNTSTLALKNFETDPNHPIYVFWDNDVPGQYGKSKFLITYYDNVEAGIWNRYWPIPHLEGDPQNKKGVMIWRWLDNGFSIKNRFGSFSDRMRAPISIESRHGKWEWNETPFKWERKFRKQNNKGDFIPNITYGLDSLGIKGSYTWLEGNIWKATWEDFRVGSFNCFFTPFVEKNFAFYTNPSSNLPVSNTYDLGRKLVGRHALKNFRVEDGLTKVNFVTGEEVYYVETNEFIKADALYVDHDITIKNNATLRIAGNSRIYLRNGASIIIENGCLEAEGTIFDFTQGTNSENIVVSAGSSLKLDDCKILASGSSTAVLSMNGGSIKIENCEIKSVDAQAGNIAVLLLSMGQSEILIKNNIIDNYTYGVLCANNRFGSIIKNRITAEYPVNMYFISDVILSENVLRGTTNNSIGMLLYNCVGKSLKNSISNCYRGSYLISSNINMGEDSIYNNFQYGLYLSNYSIAKLALLVERDDQEGYIYNNMGYNKIFNNGQMGNWTGFDNSEIYIDNSAVVFNGMFPGYNTVKDDRSGMPFSTQYLISGNQLWNQSVVLAQSTYWGYNINYTPPQNPAGRFKNIPVNFNNYLMNEPLPNKVVRPEFIVQTDYFGNIVDTIYAQTLEKIELSYIEELLSEAGKYSCQEQYEAAINVYKFIIENHGQNIETIEAYQCLMALLNIINASPADFQHFNNLCSTNEILTSDTLMKYFLEDIKISGLVSSNEIENALSELDILIQTYPNSQLAFYSELERIYLVLLDNGFSFRSQSHGDKSFYSSMINSASPIKSFLTANIGSDDIIAISSELQPESYELEANYPNPFNPITTINYHIPKESWVKLKIFDLLGKEIESLVDEYKTPGKYKVQFDAKGLSSGVYFYELRSPEFIKVKKMLLLK